MTEPGSAPSPSPFLLSDDAVRCPHRYYAVVREERPVYFEPLIGAWVVSRDADVRRVLKESSNYSNRRVTGPVYAKQMGDTLRRLVAGGQADPALLARIERGAAKVLIDADPPAHRRQRAAVASSFTPAAVAALEPRVAELTEVLLDEVSADAAGATGVDIAYRFARPLPMRVIADQLGVGGDDLADFYRWSDAFTAALGNHDHDEHTLLAILEAQAAFFEYFDRELDALEAAGRDDHLLAAVARATDESGLPLSRPEQLQMCSQFVVAGNETTAKAITMAVRMLATEPGLAQRLRAEPSLVRRLVEEVLRLESPTQGMFRQALHDTVVGGQPIGAGEHLFLVYASANRDQARFEHPDDVDLDRPQPAAHLGFGAGEHFCLGAHLARLEARVALERLLARGADLVLAEGQERWDRSYFLHGLSSLFVRFEPQARGAA